MLARLKSLLSAKTGGSPSSFTILESWIVGVVACCASAFGLSTIPLFPIAWIFPTADLSALQLWGYLPHENALTVGNPNPAMWIVMIPASALGFYIAIRKRVFSFIFVGMSTIIACLLFALIVPIIHNSKNSRSTNIIVEPANSTSEVASPSGGDSDRPHQKTNNPAQLVIWGLAALSMIGFSWTIFRIGTPTLLLVFYSAFLILVLDLSIAFLALFWVITFLLFASCFVAHENIREYQGLNKKSRRISLIAATKTWAIIPVLVALSLIAGNWFSSYVIYLSTFNLTTYKENTYAERIKVNPSLLTERIEEARQDNPNSETTVHTTLAKKSIEDDLFNEFRTLNRSEFRDAISTNFKLDLTRLDEEVRIEGEKARVKTSERINRGEDAIIAIHDELFPRVEEIESLRDDHCRGFLPVGCWIKNALKRKARGVYSATRQKSIERVRNRVKETGGNLEENSLRALAESETQMTAVLDKVKNRAIDRTAHGFFYFLILLDCLSIASFVFMSIKSWIYVFSRYVYGPGSVDMVCLADLNDRNPLPNRYVYSSSNPVFEYAILPLNEDKLEYWFAWSENPGATRYFEIPHFTRCFLSRIRYGKLVLSTLRADDRKKLVTFNAGDGHGFVEWNIMAGESVVFNMANLVVASTNVVFETIVSARGSSLLFGRLIFTIARAPADSDARLVLRTRGFKGRKGTAAAPSRLLAWHKSLQFSVQGANTFPHIFLTDYNLDPQNPRYVVPDAHNGVSVGGGMLELIKFKFRALFLPW